VAAVAHDERVTTAVDGVAHVQDDGVLAACHVNPLARVEERRDGADSGQTGDALFSFARAR
jgi:hypothetical protein